jgi:hypothetical protein
MYDSGFWLKIFSGKNCWWNMNYKICPCNKKLNYKNFCNIYDNNFHQNSLCRITAEDKDPDPVQTLTSWSETNSSEPNSQRNVFESKRKYLLICRVMGLCSNIGSKLLFIRKSNITIVCKFMVLLSLVTLKWSKQVLSHFLCISWTIERW